MSKRLPVRNENRCPQRDSYRNVHRSSVHGRPQMGKLQWQDKGAMVQSDKGHSATERRNEGWGRRWEWASVTLRWAEKSNTRVHSWRSHLYKVLEQSKQTYCDRNREVASGRKRGLWEGNTMDCPSVMRLFLDLDWSAHYMSGCLSKLIESYLQSLHILLCVNYRKSSAEFFFLGGARN